MADDDLAQDATDETEENNARRDAERIAREDADQLIRIMSHPKSRAWMGRLLDECHINESAFVAGSPDKTAFYLGQEYIGKKLWLSLMVVCPELYIKLLAEQKSDAERGESRRKEKEQKTKASYEAAVILQGFDLPPPGGEPPKDDR